MRIPFPVLAFAAVVSAAPPAASAQSINEAVGYFALLSTPPGALPPVLSRPMLNRPTAATDFVVRYGHVSLDGGSLNTYDARFAFPVGTSTVMGLDAGYQDLSCDFDCNGHFIAGANVESKIARTTLGTGVDGAQLTIGLNGELGFGKPTDATVFSLTGGLPIALVAGGPTLRIAPFLTPAFGWGAVSGGGESENGTRFLLGGGVTVQSTTSGVGANVGFQKVFLRNGKMMLGVSLIIGTR